MLITIQESRPVSPSLSLSPPLPPKILLARREESGEGNDEPGDPAGWYAAKNPCWLQEGQEGKLLGGSPKRGRYRLLGCGAASSRACGVSVPRRDVVGSRRGGLGGERRRRIIVHTALAQDLVCLEVRIA